MKKKKKGSGQPQVMTPLEEFLSKEKEREKNNQIKNRPIIIITYMMVFTYLLLFGYIIYFMQFKAETVIANSRNIRQDSFADVVERGDIITSDGVVIATSETDDEGNTTRHYPYSNMFAHLVGYDSYGKAGLELQGNFYMLRSHINIIEKIYRELSEQKNRGDNLITTVNYKLQSTAYNALGSCRGAVIVIEPDSGKILAMVSKPDYDPNNIDWVWEYLKTDEGSNSTILLNRVTQGLYAPGSTFKVVTLLEYIREYPRDYMDYEYDCSGNDIFSGVKISCIGGSVHGHQDIEDSLANSCNTSFANIGTMLDFDEFRETAEELLFNGELPFDGDYSKSTFIINGKSRPDEMPQTAIGQGDTMITPLHNAMIACAIANGGVLMKPYLIQSIENDDGATIKRFSSKSYGSIMTSNEAAILTEYMKAVCDYGSGAPYFAGLSYDVAGKTGTAEYDDEGNCNSWFIGFSNPDNPDIVVCVVVEDYQINGVKGAWVAKQIFDAYYE